MLPLLMPLVTQYLLASRIIGVLLMFDQGWGIPNEDKSDFQKRIKELDSFLCHVLPRLQQAHGEGISIVDHAPWKIGHYYWWLLVTYIRPVLAPGAKANRYKVAALLELCIVRVKPIRNPGNKRAEFRANAQLGMVAAMTVINDFIGDIRIMRPDATDTTEMANAIRTILDDHEDAMFLKNDNVMPILINSGYWQSLDCLCLAYKNLSK